MAEISVIIPSYNHAKYISGAVNSVLQQTWKDLELIVIDDGSQDNSLEILHQFSDPRVRILSQENQGAHATINRGLREATGRYLAILNSDDQFHPQRLEKCFNVFDEHPDTGLLGSFLEIINQNGEIVGTKHGYLDCNPWLLDNPSHSFRAGKNLPLALLTENYLSTTSNFFFTRASFESIGEFNPLRYTHDWDFALRISKEHPIRLLEEPLVRYRIHPGNTIRENQAAMIFEICWILAVHLPKYSNSQNFKSEQLDVRIDQLLHSIYTYNCDRVLNVMLLLRLHDNSAEARLLLDPANPERQRFISYIQGVLPSTPPEKPLSLYRRIRHRLSPLKASFYRLNKQKK